MGVIAKSLRSLLPKGRALWLRDNGQKVIEGIAEPIESLKVVSRDVIDESWPGTAVETLPQWHSTFGINYDQTARTIAEQQMMLEAMETSQGGNTLALLQEQFDKEFGGRIVVSEAYVIGITGSARCGIGRCGLAENIVYQLGYNITGTILSVAESFRIEAIIARYGPAHLTPNSLLTDPSAIEIGISGIGRTGLARTGRPS